MAEAAELTTALQTRGLQCLRDQRPLFEPLDLELPAATCIELRGDNGSGKTTLLRTLTGLHREYVGEYSHVPLHYVGHQLGCSGLLSPLENLAWHCGLLQRNATSEELLAVLKRVNLHGVFARATQSLSAGQQRRLGLARLLLTQRALWVLDEPYTALDVAGCELVDALLAEHCAQGGAVLVASHADVAVAHGQLYLEPVL